MSAGVIGSDALAVSLLNNNGAAKIDGIAAFLTIEPAILGGSLNTDPSISIPGLLVCGDLTTDLGGRTSPLLTYGSTALLP